MLAHIREWLFVFILTAFLVGGLAYNHWHDPNQGSKKLREANVQACQRGVAKAQLFVAFANEAAAARRNSAASESANGEFIQAQNDIATAKRYETIGKQWLALTPTDCQSQYPSIP